MDIEKLKAFKGRIKKLKLPVVMMYRIEEIIRAFVNQTPITFEDISLVMRDRNILPAIKEEFLEVIGYEYILLAKEYVHIVEILKEYPRPELKMHVTLLVKQILDILTPEEIEALSLLFADLHHAIYREIDIQLNNGKTEEFIKVNKLRMILTKFPEEAAQILQPKLSYLAANIWNEKDFLYVLEVMGSGQKEFLNEVGSRWCHFTVTDTVFIRILDYGQDEISVIISTYLFTKYDNDKIRILDKIGMERLISYINSPVDLSRLIRVSPVVIREKLLTGFPDLVMENLLYYTDLFCLLRQVEKAIEYEFVKKVTKKIPSLFYTGMDIVDALKQFPPLKNAILDFQFCNLIDLTINKNIFLALMHALPEPYLANYSSCDELLQFCETISDYKLLYAAQAPQTKENFLEKIRPYLAHFSSADLGSNFFDNETPEKKQEEITKIYYYARSSVRTAADLLWLLNTFPEYEIQSRREFLNKLRHITTCFDDLRHILAIYGYCVAEEYINSIADKLIDYFNQDNTIFTVDCSRIHRNIFLDSMDSRILELINDSEGVEDAMRIINQLTPDFDYLSQLFNEMKYSLVLQRLDVLTLSDHLIAMEKEGMDIIANLTAQHQSSCNARYLAPNLPRDLSIMSQTLSNLNLLRESKVSFDEFLTELSNIKAIGKMLFMRNGVFESIFVPSSEGLQFIEKHETIILNWQHEKGQLKNPARCARG